MSRPATVRVATRPPSQIAAKASSDPQTERTCGSVCESIQPTFARPDRTVVQLCEYWTVKAVSRCPVCLGLRRKLTQFVVMVSWCMGVGWPVSRLNKLGELCRSLPLALTAMISKYTYLLYIYDNEAAGLSQK